MRVTRFTTRRGIARRIAGEWKKASLTHVQIKKVKHSSHYKTLYRVIGETHDMAQWAKWLCIEAKRFKEKSGA